MRNYIAGVRVEAAGYARDGVGARIVVVPGASTAVSRQSPKVKALLIRQLNVSGFRSEH